jgi:hypothetical protein
MKKLFWALAIGISCQLIGSLPAYSTYVGCERLLSIFETQREQAISMDALIRLQLELRGNIIVPASAQTRVIKSTPADLSENVVELPGTNQAPLFTPGSIVTQDAFHPASLRKDWEMKFLDDADQQPARIGIIRNSPLVTLYIQANNAETRNRFLNLHYGYHWSGALNELGPGQVGTLLHMESLNGDPFEIIVIDMKRLKKEMESPSGFHPALARLFDRSNDFWTGEYTRKAAEMGLSEGTVTRLREITENAVDRTILLVVPKYPLFSLEGDRPRLVLPSDGNIHIHGTITAVMSNNPGDPLNFEELVEQGHVFGPEFSKFGVRSEFSRLAFEDPHSVRETSWVYNTTAAAAYGLGVHHVVAEADRVRSKWVQKLGLQEPLVERLRPGSVPGDLILEQVWGGTPGAIIRKSGN